jgi:hypothetical protein
MSITRKIEMVGSKISFAQAEEDEVSYYASLGRNESVAIVEQMRKMIWDKEYLQPMIKEVRWCNLKDDRDEFE